MATDNRNYEVGYGRPPLHTRFKKGASGNPKGRPHGSRNPGTLLKGALEELVVINENGQRKRITKLEAIFKQLVNKAAAGEPRSIQLLLASLRLLGEHPETTQSDTQPVDEADQQVMHQICERIRRWGQEETDERPESK
jgi:Family of unknown function (DUF5681)